MVIVLAVVGGLLLLAAGWVAGVIWSARHAGKVAARVVVELLGEPLQPVGRGDYWGGPVVVTGPTDQVH